jgi:hypothetical protein
VITDFAHPFGGDFIDVKQMAASLEAALALLQEHEKKISDLKAEISNMQISHIVQPGAYSPRNRRFNV